VSMRSSDSNSETLVLVAGARPNFVKVAPLLRALRSHTNGFACRLVHTGQHYDPGMSAIFFRDLGIPSPDADLGVGSGPHGAQTGRILAAFEEYLMARPLPRGVVVVGDVNSTIACALASVKLGVPVAHIEAGLRSFDRSMPEEINRVLTDAISDVLLVSEPSGEENLRREGITPARISLVGNVMIDSLARELPAARAIGMRARLGLANRHFALITLHRPSNVDERPQIVALASFLERVAARLPVVFPVHPRTRKRLEEFDTMDRLKGARDVQCLDPLGYRETIGLMSEAAVVITDSGGVQEETSYLGVPCLTMRQNTERPVTVALGTNTVLGNDWDRAEQMIEDVLEGRYKKGATIPLWDGRASERIADTLAKVWKA
jgi:UDP-N-acetylglucosamine 2-epimerase (non-hydrolysing)